MRKNTKSRAKKSAPLRKSKTEEASFIVGIGASAGGLEAYQKILNHIPDNTNMCFVIIPHLSPSHESKLPEILSNFTTMPVKSITPNAVAGPNEIWIIPPGKIIGLHKGKFQLSDRKSGNPPMLIIDSFFHSLAEDQKQKAIGVVLSGTGTDGAEGLKNIKEEGGITIAQSPDTAQFMSMPYGAIIVDDVDFVLNPEGIAKELVRLSRIRLNPVSEKEGVKLQDDDGALLQKIFSLLQQTTRVDFSGYKLSTIHRRINRRMVLLKLDNLRDYANHLRSNINERKNLHDDILIHVTQFFRDPLAFEALREAVFPAILKNHIPEQPLRIWVPGCATGEEVYSIGICLLEYLQEKRLRVPVQFFATDLSEKCLQTARTGKYGEGIKRYVSSERLQRFFTFSNGTYQIQKSVRDLCIFSKQDVLRDPPFSKLDLISCRNVLIYLGLENQKRALQTFYYALNTSRFLLLGNSETSSSSANLFALASKKYKVYEKKSANRGMQKSPTFPKYKHELHLKSKSPALFSPRVAGQLEKENFVFKGHLPANIIVSSDYKILAYRGETSVYLKSASQKAHANFFETLSPELRPEFKRLLAKSKNKTQQKKALLMKGPEGPRSVDIEVVPVKISSGKTCFMITFEENEAKFPKTIETKAEGRSLKGSSDSVGNLKRELEATQEHLQSVITDLESSNAALQAANEEILSSNEELQSTNEEIETTKEELQSSNEELTTVNDELQSRNSDLSKANDDLVNLFSSINIILIMVDANMRIKHFTPTASAVLNVIPSDIGRPITHLTANIKVTDFNEIITAAITKLVVTEREIQDTSGHWYSLRVKPYLTKENFLDGAIIALIDINSVKHLENDSSRASFRGANENIKKK